MRRLDLPRHRRRLGRRALHHLRLVEHDAPPGQREQRRAHLLRQREAVTARKLEQMQAENQRSIGKREQQFEEGCRAKEERLAALAAKENEMQERVVAMRALAAAKSAIDGGFLRLKVAGQPFVTTATAITRVEGSVLAELRYAHAQSVASGSVHPSSPLRSAIPRSTS